MTTLTKTLLAVGVLAVVGAVVSFGALVYFVTTAPPGEQRTPEIQQGDKMFSDYTDAEHIAAARKLAASKKPEQIFEGHRHLDAVKKESPEAKEVRAVRALLDDKLVEIDPLQVIKSEWRKDGFDTVSVWDVTFKNRGKAPVGNIKYRTLYMSETGVTVDRGGVDSGFTANQKTIQKVIRPGETRKIEVNDGFLNKEAHKAVFEIVSWEVVNDLR